MSSYDRTALQAVIGQKLDGQFQKLLADHERPIQQKHFCLKQLCSKAEKLCPDLSSRDNDLTIHQSEDMAYVYACADQDITDKAKAHSFTRKTLQAAQLRHGYANPKDDNSALLSVLTLLLAVCGESLINAAFFNNAHMVAGPTAALITSFLISMTNVAVCACAGFFIGRYLNYGANAQDDQDNYFRNKRVKAKFLFAGFIALMVFFHMTVGLVRAQESIEIVHHSLPAYMHMLRTPEAIFLILMGVCMSVISFHKGIYRFDCPYPEIGQLQRIEDAAKQDVQDAFEFYQEEIVAHFEDAEKSIQLSKKNKNKRVEQYNKAVSSCHEARRQLEQTARDAEIRCRRRIAELITSYNCISGNEQSVPIDTLNRMVSFDKYLDVEIPAFQAASEMNALKSELLLEKNQAVKRLASIFQNAINP